MLCFQSLHLSHLCSQLALFSLPQLHTSNFPVATLICRDAHGRLLRQTGSGTGWGGLKPAVQHPPPFGAPAGSACRSLSEQ